MERPKTPNPIPNPTGEESRQKEPELQIVQTYKDDAFFLKVIAENHTEKRKHIAIIGEPGAGKTTLLGELADRLCRGGFVDNPCHPQTSEINPPLPSHTPHETQTTQGGFLTDTSCHPQTSRINPPLPSHNENFPICIRLADLRSSTIADYLLNNWLSKALQFIDYDAENVTPEIRKEFKQLFAAGKVCLLLDGVDEMAATSPIEALATIREQLTDWVGKARVVLTCRLNVWDAAISNTLTDFDTYKTLEFEPDDVDEFIRQWFEEASQDEKRRNSVGPPNPPILGGTSSPPNPPILGGTSSPPLPLSPPKVGGLGGANPVGSNETFWREQGKRLTRQLKEPGKERIKELVRNPLRLSMLCQSWCVPEQELPETKAALYEQFTTYFFEWKQEEFSKKQRLLNQRDKKQIQQALAKLALAAMSSVNRFRIEQDFAIEQMEEVWFNLADELGWLVLVDRDSRTKKPVYAFFHPTFQEYFAACAIGDWHFFLLHKIPPVSDCSYRIFERQWREVILLWLGRGDIADEEKEEFVESLMTFKTGCYGNSYWYRSYFLAAAGINEFKSKKSQEIVKNVLNWICVEEIQSTTYFDYIAIENIAREAIQILPETDRTMAISVLVELLKNSSSEPVCWFAAYSLGKINPSNLESINYFVNLLEKSEDENTGLIAAYILSEINPGNPEAIRYCIKVLENSSDESIQKMAASCLGEIARNNQQAILALVKLLTTAQDEYTFWRIAEKLGKVGRGNEEAINILCNRLRTTNNENEYDRWKLAYSLGEIEPKNKQAVATLVNILETTKDEYICDVVAYSLGIIDPGNPKAINAVIKQLELTKTKKQNIFNKASVSLSVIGRNNQHAISYFRNLLANSQDEYILRSAACSLGNVDFGNPEAIDILIKLIQNTKDADIRRGATEDLGEVGIGNQQAIAALVNLLDTTKDKSLQRQAINSLEQIITNDEQRECVVISLKLHLNNETYENNFDFFEKCYKHFWEIAQNLPYPDFYQAWHQDTLTNTATANLNIANLPQVLAEAINNQPELCSKVKLICIDTHQFIDPENPAPEIYDQMLNQNCPEWQNGYPETMQKLKLYWNYLRRINENPLFFICYDSTALTATPTGFSLPFLTALSKFDGAICVVTSPPNSLSATERGSNNNSPSSVAGEGVRGWGCLQTFSPSQPNLIADIVGWMREKMIENL
ncbi:HEAT repeat domain-containing protein [Argonema galeatum]|uniref:NACHT C-terminal alpha/beta 1 domain-containing protein n=1 Tax=Argonema galeatum TaxID=2942762 RepID=UPI0020133347|nr:HEAT repeat domain-containing protein [Argonema galeatum]MCL1464649.1 HEAT repeat domain-containing protein [Argonema galeatum A003/A1]